MHRVIPKGQKEGLLFVLLQKRDALICHALRQILTLLTILERRNTIRSKEARRPAAITASNIQIVALKLRTQQRLPLFSRLVVPFAMREMPLPNKAGGVSRLLLQSFRNRLRGERQIGQLRCSGLDSSFGNHPLFMARSMIGDPESRGRNTSHHRSPGGRANRRGSITLRKDHSFLHKLIEKRRLKIFVSLKAGIPPSKIIGHDDHDIGKGGEARNHRSDQQRDDCFFHQTKRSLTTCP